MKVKLTDWRSWNSRKKDVIWHKTRVLAFVWFDQPDFRRFEPHKVLFLTEAPSNKVPAEEKVLGRPSQRPLATLPVGKRFTQLGKGKNMNISPGN